MSILGPLPISSLGSLEVFVVYRTTKIVSCCLNRDHQKGYVQVLKVSLNLTLFRNRVFADVIEDLKMR